MTILIADDEELVRYTIVSILKGLEIKNLTIIEAPTGWEMIKKVNKFKPDGAFVDIRMPGLSGLDALEYIKANNIVLYRQVDWFILTGFAEFEFAQKAINAGVVNYLLKPISSKEVKESVELMRKSLEKREKELRGKRETEFLEFRANIIGVDDIVELSGFCYHRGNVFFNDSFINISENLEQNKYIFSRMYDFYSADVSFTLSFLKEGNLFILESSNVKEAFDEQLHRYLKEVLVNTNFFSGTIVRTPIRGEVRNIFKDIDRTLEFSGNRHFLSLNTIRFVELDFLEDIHGKEPGHFIEQLFSACYLEAVDQIDRILLKKPVLLTTIEVDKNFISNVKRLFNITVNVLSFDDLVEKIVEYYRFPLSKTGVHPLIQQTLTILEKRYCETIGIREIATMLFVTPNYLSSVFKREMKISFTKYLTLKRLEISRELLLETGALIKSVSTTIGFGSDKHFSKVFKKYYGISPSEYIKRSKVV